MQTGLYSIVSFPLLISPREIPASPAVLLNFWSYAPTTSIVFQCLENDFAIHDFAKSHPWGGNGGHLFQTLEFLRFLRLFSAPPFPMFGRLRPATAPTAQPLKNDSAANHSAKILSRRAARK
jgi:hypothetical protein